MFDQFKAMGAVAGLLQDKERLREIAEAFKAKLERIRVEGEAGGGAVRVSVSGQMRVVDVHLEPSLIAGLAADEGAGREMVQALIEEATNDALAKAQTLVQQEAQRQAEELGLPSIPGMASLLT